MTVAVRTDLTAAEVRELARAAATPDQARRLLAIALVLEGASREDAARSTGMDRQTLRDWVHRFNAAGADGLVDRKAPGRQRRLSQDQLDELALCLERGPAIERDGGGAVAPDRSLRPGRAALRRPLPGARHGQARPGARLQPGLGPAAAPQIRPRGASRVQKKLPELIAAAVGEQASGKRLEIWFQML